jgi:small conductance mechanosensitive channel
VGKVIGKLIEWADTLIYMLPNLVIAVFIILASYLIARLVRKLLERTLSKVSRNESVTSLITSLIFGAINIAGLFIALGILNLNKTVMSLLAGVGIMVLALGFAFKDIASNFLSGI